MLKKTRNISLTRVAIVTLVILAASIAYFRKPAVAQFHDIPILKWTCDQTRTEIRELSYKVNGTYDFGKIFGKTNDSPLSKTSNFEVEGLLEWTCLNSDFNDQMLFNVAFSGRVKSLINNAENASLNKTIANDLSKPVLVTLSSNGEIIKIISKENINQVSIRLMQDILYLRQSIFPKDGSHNPAAWESREYDFNGAHSVRYELVSEEKSSAAYLVRFSKKKLDYEEPVFSGSGPQAASETPSDQQGFIKSVGDVKTTFDAIRGRINSIDGSIQQEVSWNNMSLSQWTTEIHEKLVDVKTKNPSISAFEPQKDHYKDVTISKESTESAENHEKNMKEKVIQERNLGGESLMQLFEDLETFDSQHLKMTSKETAAFVKKFYAWVYLHPNDLQTLAERLQESPHNSDVFVFGLGALVQNGYQEAQKIILALIDHSMAANDIGKLNTIIASSGFLKNPERSVEQAVSAISNTSDNFLTEATKATAALALGNMASSLTKKDPERSDEILKNLLNGIKTAAKDGDIITLLRATSNTHKAIEPTAIMPFLKNTSPVIRSEAFRVLSQKASESDVTVLSNYLNYEPNENARFDSIEFLRTVEKPERWLPILLAQFSIEPAEIVRTSIIRGLWQMRSTSPDVIKFIHTAAFNDDSSSVRQTARQLLLLD